MTMTEPPPAMEPQPINLASSPATGLYDWLATSDHKRIGRTWIHASLLMLLVTTIVGVLIGFEQVDASSVDIFGGDNGYFQLWGLYQFALVLMVAAPLMLGLAMVVVPMQVGASNIAFPRAALAAGWGYVLGTGITVVSVLAGGGWGALDGVSGDEADAIALTLLGTGMVVVSLLLGAICVATTVISLRTSGMNLMRVPLFAWSMLVACAVWLLTLPIAVANLAIMYTDLRGGPLTFGNPEGSDAMYAQLAWILDQPQIYAIAIPALGIIGSIVPVAAGARQIAHRPMVAFIGLFGLLSVGGWSQPYFANTSDEILYIAFGIGIVLPVFALIGGAVATLAAGDAPAGLPAAHLLGALGAGVSLLFAVICGAMKVIEPFDLIGTSAHGGLMNLTALAAITAALAGIWFWAPKIGGDFLPSGLGRLVMLGFIAGALLLGAPQVVAGFVDAPNLMLFDTEDSVVNAMSLVSAIGAVLVALGAIGVIAAVVSSKRNPGDAPGDNPWSGHTLEWATTSAPPVGNFAEPLAKVVSEAPLLDLADEEVDA
jgi:heme/copper-type cytochrome/quinol oxidase subunit 1